MKKSKINENKCFIIMKKSRAYDNPTPRNAYRGPAAENLAKDNPEFKPGQVYGSREEAEKWAKELTRYNGVGFEVIPLQDFYSGSGNWNEGMHESKKINKKVIKEMGRGRPKKYEIIIDPDTGEEIKVPISGKEEKLDKNIKLVYDPILQKYVSKEDDSILGNAGKDDPTELMKQYSPFRIKESDIAKAIRSSLKEMDTGGLAVGVAGGNAVIDDPEGDKNKISGEEEVESEEVIEVRKHIRSILMKEFIKNKKQNVDMLEAKLRKEIENFLKEKNEVRKFVAKKKLTEASDMNDYEIDDEFDEDLNDGFVEDDMFPEETDSSYQQPIEMLKNLMKDDYDLTGRFGQFEEYYTIISDEFEIADESLDDDTRSELKSWFDYYVENPEELNYEEDDF